MKPHYCSLFIILSFISCTNDADDCPFLNKNQIKVSDIVNNDTKTSRYVFSPNGLSTKSVNSYDAELTSLMRENLILDSLSDAAKAKGINLKIYYVKPISDTNPLTRSYFDSTDYVIPVDTCGDFADSNCCSVPITVSGTLKKGETSEIDDLSIGADYSIELEGYCSASISGSIYAYRYKVYHNLLFYTGDGAAYLLTSSSDNIELYMQPYHYGISQDCSLSGINCFCGPLNSISVSYSNSELQNNIVWNCDYLIIAILSNSLISC